MKQVRETRAGLTISVHIILKKGKEVARVHAHHGGVVQVDVFDNGELVHQGRAGGGGYDRFTAALAGAVIQGHELTNHCDRGTAKEPKTGYWSKDAKPKRGYRFTNYESGKGYKSCYKIQGLDYLKSFGFDVIDAF